MRTEPAVRLPAALAAPPHPRGLSRTLDAMDARLERIGAAQARMESTLSAVHARLVHLEGDEHHRALQTRIDAVAQRLDDLLSAGRQSAGHLWHLVTLLLGAALATGGSIVATHLLR